MDLEQFAKDANDKMVWDKGEVEEPAECPESPTGKHNFVECDEWEPTCSYCGKFEE